jgi:hypothetical protein
VVNEHHFELPDLERLILSMKPNRRTVSTAQSYTFTTDKLLEKLRQIISQGSFAFAGGRPADAKALADFLYKIDFIIARRCGPDGIDRKYFEQNRYLSSSFVEFGYNWEIHPAYRWALQPGSVMQLFGELSPSAD